MKLMRPVLSCSYDVVLLLSAMIMAFSPRNLTTKDRGLTWFRRRLQSPSRPQVHQPYWIHGVSAGEIKAANAFVKSLNEINPKQPVVLSSSTPAGLAAASLVDKTNVFLMPFDLRRLMDRTVSRINPACIILIESELWPQLLHAAMRQHVPIFVLSAKISARSYQRLSKLPSITKELLSPVTHYFAQDTVAGAQLRGLGVRPSKITISWNLKLIPPVELKGSRYQSAEFDGTPILVFGNVHPDETHLIAKVVERIVTDITDLAVLVVPRHPEKYNRNQVESLFLRSIRFVSNGEVHPHAGEICWVNQMGVLASIYDIADIAVVCGTFCDVGGHDLVEPLHRGALVIYGPDTHGQSSLHSWLSDKDYAIQVQNIDQLHSNICNLLKRRDKNDLLRRSASSDLGEFKLKFSEIVEIINSKLN